MSVLKLGNGTFSADPSWDGMELWFNCSAGRAVIDLPATGVLPDGWNCILRKADPTSNAIQLRANVQGNRINHFWDYTHPHGRYLNMTQNLGRLSYGGEGEYCLAGMTHHRHMPQSQRTVTIPQWNLTPESEYEIIRCDVQQAGGSVAIIIDPIKPHWCPDSPQTGGNYLSSVFWIQKCDPGPGRVSIWVDGSRIFPSNDKAVTGYDRGYYHLSQQWETVMFYVAADGAKVVGAYRGNFTGAV